jgi:hypothetical protein
MNRFGRLAPRQWPGAKSKRWWRERETDRIR